MKRSHPHEESGDLFSFHATSTASRQLPDVRLPALQWTAFQATGLLTLSITRCSAIQTAYGACLNASDHS